MVELLRSWWQHRVSFLISLAITITALGLYVFTYIGEHSNPLLVFVERLELDALDTRFRMRPAKYSSPDPRIVIVDIDQRSQEGLGKWPFSRTNFAIMLDVLREDGAKVVGFDVTFDKPDQTAAPVRALAEQLEKRKAAGQHVDPKLQDEIKALAAEYDADRQFGAAIQKFGNVVLGNFFFPREELKGTDETTLNSYAELVQWYSLGQNSLNPATGKQDFGVAENQLVERKIASLLATGIAAEVLKQHSAEAFRSWPLEISRRQNLVGVQARQQQRAGFGREAD